MACQLAAKVQPDIPSSGRELLETYYDLIQQKLSRLSRQSGLPEYEAEELRSWALFKLVEDDYRMLAAWEGRSSFSTYLTVILVNLMRDYRVRVWGKWRPSATARRRGREAVLLERLWIRNGLPLDEAIERMRTEHRVALSPAELERIAVELPRRTERRRVGEEELRDLAVHGSVEARVEAGERAQAAILLRREVLPALRALPAEDRLLLKLCCRDGLTMAAIASALRRPQRELYSARDRCLRTLRRTLEQSGLSAQWLRDHAGTGGWDFLVDEAGIWEEIPNGDG
jgi:DNA-directed RNA polymerase specialized sigma24 family protein